MLKRGLWIGDFDDVLPRKAPFYEHTECGGIYSPHATRLKPQPSKGGSKDL